MSQKSAEDVRLAREAKRAEKEAAAAESRQHRQLKLDEAKSAIARLEEELRFRRKIFSIWNDSSPRKVILTLCDAQLRDLLDLRCKGGSPTKWMQAHYRRFRTSVQ